MFQKDTVVPNHFVITLCDPIWHAGSRSVVRMLLALTAILLYLYLFNYCSVNSISEVCVVYRPPLYFTEITTNVSTFAALLLCWN